MECDLNSIYKFCKSYAERYDEYCSILCGDNEEIVSVRERWSLYLEVSMGSFVPTQRWYAYWNILRTYCDGMNITFPKVVQVQVIEVDYEKLSADVLIINLQEDEELKVINSVIEAVPLKDLYVTTLQDIPNLDEIANCLDQLRFFYHHLWWPWIDEENEVTCKSIDWVLDHLKNRLELYYEKLEAKIPYVSAKTIKRLMEKCKEFYDLLHNTDDLHPTLVDRCEFNTMRVELNLWSIPEMRQLKIEEQKKASSTQSALIALQECEIHDAEVYLRQVKDIFDLKKLRDIPIKLITSNFENCHLNYNPNDIIVLTSGEYKLNYMEYFDFPVSIIGLNSPPEMTVISDQRSFWSIFQSLTTSVCIENVAFHLKFSRAVFILKKGSLVLNNVLFNGIQSMDTIAIQLHKNTKLIARKCRFLNFDIAIVCQQGAVIELDDCIFENNSSCMQFTEGAKITMNNCDLRSTENTPFVYERNSNKGEIREKSCESLDHLSRIPGISIHQIQLDDEMIAVENT